MKRWRRMIAGALMLALLAGCGKPSPDPAESPVPTLSPEELAAVEKAEALLEGFRWPRETETKTLAGQEVEFVLHHGPGWTIQVPADWEQAYTFDWRAPSGNAGFSVSKWDLPVNNPKIYRAQMGSWRHETDYPAPFDYYYDDDGGYVPPEGSADYVYFFAPAGEKSYELTLLTVVGATTDLEKAVQEAMLLSFTQDESVHALCTEDYQPGRSLWDFVTSGLLSRSEALWFEGWNEETSPHSFEADGKTSPEYVSYAMALGAFQPGEFVQTYFGRRPEGVGELRSYLDLCLKDLDARLYLYPGTQWVSLTYAGEDWWTQLTCPDDPTANPYDAALAWMEAERTWAEP